MMTKNQPRQDQAGAGQLAGDQTIPGRGWLGLWRLLIVLLALLLSLCGYWIMTRGFANAFYSDEFLLTLIVAIVVLLCIGARVMMRMLRSGTFIDSRNFIDMSRSQRFRRR